MREFRIDRALLASLVVYVGIALAVTYPYVLHPGTTLTASLFADVSGSVSKFQTLVREHKSPFWEAHLTTIGWPDGVTLQPLLDRVAFLNTLFLWGGSLLIGSIATHSLMTVLGFVLTAVITCLFVRGITGSTAAGFIAGLAYGFWPHMLLIASAAPTYTWMWMFILPIWAFYTLALTPTLRAAVIAGLSPLPAMFWTPYFALHVSVVAFACAAVVGIRAAAAGELTSKRLLQLVPAAALPVVALSVYAGISALSHSSGIPARSLDDAFQESAHPLMYVIPGWGSSWGSAPDDFLVRHVPRAQYANLYVGLSVIGLAAVAFVIAVASFWRDRTAALRSPLVVATFMASSVVALCFLFSLPPHYRVAGHQIPTPDALVIAVQPAFRGGQRFVMPLMGGAAVLAGIGVQLILKQLPSRARPVFVLLLAPLIFFDLFASRPDAVQQVPQSTALAALLARPDGPTFEYYPIDADGPGRIPPTRPCLLQPQHGKTLVDTCELVPQSQQYQHWIHDHTCSSLSDMRQAGVRYVIVDDSLGSLIACFSGELSGVSVKLADDGRLSAYEFR